VTPVLMLFGGIVEDWAVTTCTWLSIGIAVAIACYKNRRFKIKITGPHEATALAEE